MSHIRNSHNSFLKMVAGRFDLKPFYPGMIRHVCHRITRRSGGDVRFVLIKNPWMFPHSSLDGVMATGNDPRHDLRPVWTHLRGKLHSALHRLWRDGNTWNANQLVNLIAVGGESPVFINLDSASGRLLAGVSQPPGPQAFAVHFFLPLSLRCHLPR